MSKPSLQLCKYSSSYVDCAIVYVYLPIAYHIFVEQHPTLVLSFVMFLLTIMLCVAPQLLFAATLTASINKEQQSRQAMGAGHKAIITYESTSESIKRLLMLALTKPFLMNVWPARLHKVLHSMYQLHSPCRVGFISKYLYSVKATLVPIHKIKTLHLPHHFTGFQGQRSFQYSIPVFRSPSYFVLKVLRHVITCIVLQQNYTI